MENGAAGPSPLNMLIEEMKARTQDKRKITVMSKSLWQYPTVFDTELTEQGAAFSTTELLRVLAEEMDKKPGEAFALLEIGCGTGLTSIMAALYSKKCQVWATDVNPSAVKNTAENAKLHGVDNQVRTATGDVFKAPGLAGKTFDIIFWSHPFIPFKPDITPDRDVSFLEKGLMDPGYRGLRDFILGVKAFMKSSRTRVFIVFSFEIGSEEMFRRVLSETSWRYVELARSEVEMSFTIQPIRMKTELVFLELFGI